MVITFYQGRVRIGAQNYPSRGIMGFPKSTKANSSMKILYVIKWWVKKKNQICHRAMLCQYMYKPWNIEY
jgi:hypothetical protein